MKRVKFGICVVFALLNVIAFSQKKLDATFLNPVLAGDYPDPSIMRDGKDFYMTHSAFNYVPGLTVFHSTDLINWKPISYALRSYLGPGWAPDICKFDDKYYIYFTVAEKGNFVVYASSPYGPWSKPVDLKIGQIDPCHVVDENGERWLFLSDGYRAKLAEDGLSVISNTFEKVYEGWKIPEDWIYEGFALEGPKLKKIGHYYYMLIAEGGTAGPPTSHMVVVARSKSINGPWENAPNNPIVHTYSSTEKWWSKGHGSLVDLPDSSLWIFYHAYENQFLNLGRQTLLEPVFMNTERWIVAPTGALVDKPLRTPLSLGEKVSRKDILNEFRIGFEWRFYKNYDSTRISFNNEILTMRALGKSLHESAPLLFISGDHSYEFSVEIEKDENSVAGLTLFYNEAFYVGTGFDSQNRIRWRKGAEKGRFKHPGRNHLWLKIRNEKQIVTGYYSYDGKTWVKENWGMDITGYNHNTLYDFQSILPGIFAYGEGNVRFKNFMYQKLD